MYIYSIITIATKKEQKLTTKKKFMLDLHSQTSWALALHLKHISSVMYLEINSFKLRTAWLDRLDNYILMCSKR